MINEIHNDANSRMDKTLSSLEGDFSKIRAGRAHPSLLEQINVEYYGTLVPISQVSGRSVESRSVIQCTFITVVSSVIPPESVKTANAFLTK